MSILKRGPFSSQRPAVFLGIIALALLFVAVWTERFLRRLCPLIFVPLPDRYRRILLRMVTPPPKQANSVSQVAAK